METPTTEEAWKREASREIKAILDITGVSYAGLAKLMGPYGFTETKDSVAAKLRRGTMSLAWSFAALAAIRATLDELGLSEAHNPFPKRSNRFPMEDVLEVMKLPLQWEGHSQKIRRRKN